MVEFIVKESSKKLVIGAIFNLMMLAMMVVLRKDVSWREIRARLCGREWGFTLFGPNRVIS